MLIVFGIVLEFGLGFFILLASEIQENCFDEIACLISDG